MAAFKCPANAWCRKSTTATTAASAPTTACARSPSASTRCCAASTSSPSPPSTASPSRPASRWPWLATSASPRAARGWAARPCASAAAGRRRPVSARAAAGRWRQAMDFMMRKRIVDADEALRLGLVHQVVAGDELEAATMDLATELANGPQVSMRLLKRSIYNAAELNWEQSPRRNRRQDRHLGSPPGRRRRRARIPRETRADVQRLAGGSRRRWLNQPLPRRARLRTRSARASTRPRRRRASRQISRARRRGAAS